MHGLGRAYGNLQVIGKARVPIIKFETTGYGGIAFDVSFDVANGPQVSTEHVWKAGHQTRGGAGYSR